MSVWGIWATDLRKFLQAGTVYQRLLADVLL